MSTEFFDLLQNAKTAQELIEQAKKIFESQIDYMDSNISTLITGLEQALKSYQQNQTEKGDKELELSNLTTELKSLEPSRAKLETTKSELSKQLEELETKLSAIKKENHKLSEEKDDHESSKKQLEAKITNTKKEIEETKAGIGRILQSQKVELKALEEDIKVAQEEIYSVKESNPVLDFLLEESAEEILEVDIVAIVLENQSINLDELKKIVSIPPVSILRTVKQLENENIIKYNEETKEIRL
ncbi:MAG: hypothetical protein ACFFCZ_13045 [Promethearchaeota archaeon]